jgi:hypothetical protein
MKRAPDSDIILKYRVLWLIITVFAVFNLSLAAQTIPAPREHFGFSIGDDYCLATYSQTEAYFKKLSASDRTKLVDIGLTEEGRHQYMLIISSPSNIKDLEKYRDIAEKLARAEGLSEEQARNLSDEGKAVVWIDGGLHATEVVGSHQLIETAWKLVSGNDKETMTILENVIVLIVHANPDGQELVGSWYMRQEDPLKRTMNNIPKLYEKYAGHDNNRDFYMLSLKETRNMSTQLYLEWFPQILYNHHQSGPAGTVLAGPPYRDPFNYVYDPLVMTSLDAVGAAMISRLNAEGKPGYTQRTGASFSTWYNGGLRTTSYFHNIVGLLTEIIGNPTPMEIPFVPDRMLPGGANPYPVSPQKWHFRQSIEYSLSLNYAVLDYASRHRSELLFNIYRMGMNSVKRGSSDNWTITPKVIDAVKNAYSKDRQTSDSRPERADGGTSGYNRTTTIPLKYFEQVIKDPLKRDARAYIIPSDQNDFPTAVRFVNALIGSGIQVHKAASDFVLSGKKYPAGSYIIKCAQAFRPYIIDLFEPQDHPNDLQYPGGPPIPPYDAAGWTLAFQMGIKFTRILDNPDGQFEALPYGELQSPQATEMPASAGASGFILSPRVNNSFIVANDLMSKGIPVYRLKGDDKKQAGIDPGSFYIPSSSKARTALANISPGYGVKVSSTTVRPSQSERISPARVAIWNRYGGSMPAGWISWIMEQFHFSYKFIYAQNIDSGNLKKDYDIIILVSGAIPQYRAVSDSAVAAGQRQQGRSEVNENIPAEYRAWTGSITPERSIPQIIRFIEEGGTVITIGTSTNLAYYLRLPVKNALVRTNDKGEEVALRQTEYYIPGSLLVADIDTLASSNWGMPSRSHFYFEDSPVFRLGPDAVSRGIRKLAWFSTDAPLSSGWALGQGFLKDGVPAFEAPVGKGKFCAFGPEITFRSQPHGTFKLLFNQLYISGR